MKGEIKMIVIDKLIKNDLMVKNRKFIPFAFFSSTNILSDTCLCIQNATLFHFGVFEILFWIF